MLSFSVIVAMSLSCDERRWRQQRFLEYRALLAATQWLVSTFSCFFSCFIGPDKLFAKFASCHSRQFCWNFCKLSFWPTFTQKVLPDDFFANCDNLLQPLFDSRSLFCKLCMVARPNQSGWSVNGWSAWSNWSWWSGWSAWSKWLEWLRWSGWSGRWQ